MKRRILAIMLSAMMLVAFTPVFGFADDENEVSGEAAVAEETQPEATEVTEEVAEETQPEATEETAEEAAEEVAEEAAEEVQPEAAEEVAEEAAEEVQPEAVEEVTEAAVEKAEEPAAEKPAVKKAKLAGAGQVCTIDNVLSMVDVVCSTFFESVKAAKLDSDSFVGHFTLKYQGEDLTYLDMYDSEELFQGFGINDEESVKSRLKTTVMDWYENEGACRGTFLLALFGYDRYYNMGGVYGVQDLGLIRSDEYDYDNSVHMIGGDEYYDEDFEDYDSNHDEIMEEISSLEDSLLWDDFGWIFEGVFYGMINDFLHKKDSSKDSNTDASPQTGDSSSGLMAGTMALIALLGGAAALTLGRRKTEE